MRILFWDIDGTLLLTQRAGIDALKESMRIRYGKNDFEFSHSLAGRTDSFIIKNAITEIKGKCTASDAAGLLITYNKILPQFLAFRSREKAMLFYQQHEALIQDYWSEFLI